MPMEVVETFITTIRLSTKTNLVDSVAILAQVAAGRQLHSGLSPGGHLIRIKLRQSGYVAFGSSTSHVASAIAQ